MDILPPAQQLWLFLKATGEIGFVLYGVWHVTTLQARKMTKTRGSTHGIF
jgi:hypothetical protein